MNNKKSQYSFLEGNVCSNNLNRSGDDYWCTIVDLDSGLFVEGKLFKNYLDGKQYFEKLQK